MEKQENKRKQYKSGASELEVLSAVRAEIDRLGIANNPTQQQYQKKRDPKLAPSPSAINHRFGYKWRDVVEKIGLHLNNTNWNRYNDAEIIDMVSKFVYEKKIGTNRAYLTGIGGQHMPSVDHLRTRFGKRALAIIFENAINRHGVYPGVAKRSWNIYNAYELLDYVHAEIQAKGIKSRDDYNNFADRLQAPTLIIVMKRYGSSQAMYRAYEKKFGVPMFTPARRSEKKRLKDEA